MTSAQHPILGSLTCAIVLALAPVTLVGADADQAAYDQPSSTEAESEARPQPPSSLDDLLGIDEEERDPSAEEAARRDSEEDLQRRLTGREIADAFTEAVEKMHLSARLLDEDFDTGLGTQRIQEDIIAKLQQLIEQARQGAMCPSGDGDSQQPSQPQDDPGQQQDSQQQQQAGSPDAADGDGDTEGMPPGFQQDDQIGTEIAETREEWGALPDRIREMLLQGREERFSSLYEQFTREYYRRLAEEN